MKLIIVFALSFSLSYSYGQAIECQSVSLEKLNLENPKSVLSNVNKLKPCGLDELDIKIFSNGPIVGNIMVNMANQNKPLKTWGDLLIGINIFKQTEAYQSIRLHPEYLDQPGQGYKPVPDFKSAFSVLDDYDKAFAISKKSHKPLLVYFSSDRSINSIRFEREALEDPNMIGLLNNFITVRLSVDSQTFLSKPYTSQSGRQLKTAGQKNADLQMRLFNQNAQPFFAIIGLKDQFIGYMSSQDFIKFLIDAKTKWDRVN